MSWADGVLGTHKVDVDMSSRGSIRSWDLVVKKEFVGLHGLGWHRCQLSDVSGLRQPKGRYRSSVKLGTRIDLLMTTEEMSAWRLERSADQ